jgi:hypothetical protein
VTSSTPFEPPSEDRGAPWYRHRAVLLGAAVVVILAVAVITDLPTPASPGSQVSTANAFIAEVNSDLAPCDYALGEAYGFRADQLHGTLTTSDAAQVPGLLRDDEMACSYAGPTIPDLTGIESPGTVANGQLGQLLSIATQWATYDALSAVDEIQELFEHPGSTTDAKKLFVDTLELDKDRTDARRAVRAADRLLHATLHQVDMVHVTVPHGS